MHLARSLTLGLTLLLGTGCASLFAGISPPEVNVSNLIPLDSTLFEQRIQVDLRFRNPNDQPLEATGIDFLLEVNGAQLARGLGNEPFTVPRLGETVVSVVATTTVLDVARQLLALSERQELSYVLSGHLHLASPVTGSVAFQHEGRPLN
jgi:LEA14-like dessication related protein